MYVHLWFLADLEDFLNINEISNLTKIKNALKTLDVLMGFFSFISNSKWVVGLILGMGNSYGYSYRSLPTEHVRG